MPQLINSNNSIGDGLPASVMRESMENKNLLANKGSIYVGTGSNNSIMTGYNVSTTMALEHGAPGTILRYTNDANSPTGFEQIDPATTEDFIANKATNVDLDGEVIQNSSGIFVNVSAGSGSNFSHQIPNASTSGFGVVKLIDSLTDTSTSFALTANKGKVLQDTKASSETTIEGFSLGNASKTINGLFRYDAGEDGETILDNSNASQALTNLFTNISSSDNVVSTIVGPALGFVPDSGLSDFSSNTTTVKIGRNNSTASGAQRIVSIGAYVTGVSTNSVSVGYGANISGATNSSAFGYRVQNTAPNSVSIGAFSQCFGTAGNGAVAIGYGANAAGGVSIGKNSSTKQNEDICIGSNNTDRTAQANNGIVIGAGGYANGSGAIAIGCYSTSVNSSVAIGYCAAALQNESISVGYNCNANGAGSIVIGDNAFSYKFGNIIANNSVVVGHNASSYSKDGIVIGNNSTCYTYSNNSIAIGTSSNSASENSIAIGTSSKSNKSGSITIGQCATSYGNEGIAVGKNSSSGYRSVSIGKDTAACSSSIAIGNSAQATAENSAAVGTSATATGVGSVAISGAAATGSASLAIGSGAGASSSGGIAVGNGAQAYSVYNNTTGGIAIGTEAYNYGNNSITIGTAINQDSDSIAIGNGAHVSGTYDTSGYNSSSIVIGQNASLIGPTDSFTDPSHDAIAIGNNASVNGGYSSNYSIAIGTNACARGSASIAIGRDSKTLRQTMISIGSNCQDMNNTFFGIGIGHNVRYSGYCVSIGANSYVSPEGVSIGHNAHSASNCVSIGYNANCAYNTLGYPEKSICAGYGATSNSSYSSAIGANSFSSYHSVALGYNANASNSYEIVLGDANITALRCQVRTISELSDRRVKEEISLANTSICLNDVNRLPVSRFKYKKFTGTHLDEHRTGFMADDVELVFPKDIILRDEVFPELDEDGNEIFDEITSENGETEIKRREFVMKDVKSISMAMSIPTLWGAVQELSKLLDQSNEKIAELEQRIAILEAK